MTHNFYYKKVKSMFRSNTKIASTGCSCGCWLGDVCWSRHYARLMHRRHVSDEGSLEAFVIIGGFLLGVVGVLLVGVYGFGWFSNATANFRGNVAVRNQTQANGNYRIASYNQFFDQCAAIQTMETRIAASQEALKHDAKGSFDSQRDRDNLYAEEAQRAELINQYNADASKSYTEGQFRDSRLPYQLSVSDKETQCTL